MPSFQPVNLLSASGSPKDSERRDCWTAVNAEPNTKGDIGALSLVPAVAMKFLVFGFGYSALHISQRLRTAGAEVTATVRSRAKVESLKEVGITARVFSPEYRDAEIASDIAASDAILSLDTSGPVGRSGTFNFPGCDRRRAELALGGLSVHGRRLWRPRRPVDRRDDASLTTTTAFADQGGGGTGVAHFRRIARSGPAHLQAFRNLRSADEISWRNLPLARRGASSSRGRCSTGFMWLTSPLLSKPR